MSRHDDVLSLVSIDIIRTRVYVADKMQVGTKKAWAIFCFAIAFYSGVIASPVQIQRRRIMEKDGWIPTIVGMYLVPVILVIIGLKVWPKTSQSHDDNLDWEDDE